MSFHNSNPNARPHPQFHQQQQQPRAPTASRARSGSVAVLPSSYTTPTRPPGLHKSVSTNNLTASSGVRYHGNRSNPNLTSSGAATAFTSNPVPASTFTSTSASNAIPSSTSTSMQSSAAATHHQQDDRLHTWISDQVTRLAGEDLGISFASSSLVRREEEEMELFSASTYVPAALRRAAPPPPPHVGVEAKESVGESGDERVRRGRARAGTVVSEATTVQPVGGGAEWYWRSSPSSHSPSPHHPPSSSREHPSSSSSSSHPHPHLHSLHPSPTPTSASQSAPASQSQSQSQSPSPSPYPTPSPSSSDEFDPSVHGVAYHHRTPSRALVEEVRERGSARSDSPLLGFYGEGEGEGEECVEGRGGVGEAERGGRRGEGERQGQGGRQGGGVEDDRVKHRRSKSSGETVEGEYDFPRTPGPEDLGGEIGVWFGPPLERDVDVEDEDVYSPSTVAPLNLVKKNSSSEDVWFVNFDIYIDIPFDFDGNGYPIGPFLALTFTFSDTYIDDIPRIEISSPKLPRACGAWEAEVGDGRTSPSPSPSNSPSSSRLNAKSPSPSTSPNVGYASSPSFLSTSPGSQTFVRSTSPSSPSRSSPLLGGGYSLRGAAQMGVSMGGLGGGVGMTLDPGDHEKAVLSRKPSLAKKPSFGAVREVCEEYEDGDADAEADADVDAVEDVSESELETPVGSAAVRDTVGDERGRETRDRSASASTVASFRTAKTDVEGGGEVGVFSDDEDVEEEVQVEGERYVSEEEVEEDQSTVEDRAPEPKPSPPIEMGVPTKPPPPTSRMRSQSASVVRGPGLNVKTQQSLLRVTPVNVGGGGGHGHGYSQSVSYAPSHVPSASATHAPAPSVAAAGGAAVPTRASIGLGLGPGVGVRIQTRSRAGSVAQCVLPPSVAMSTTTTTPPLSASLVQVAPPPSAASFLAPSGYSSRSHSRHHSLVTPPGTGRVSGLESVGAAVETPARHAVYIVDGEEVSRRLGELVGELNGERGGGGDDGEVEEESERWRGGYEERGRGREEMGWDEGNRKTVMLRDLNVHLGREEEEEEGDPVLPLGDYVLPKRIPAGPQEDEGDKTVTVEAAAEVGVEVESVWDLMTEEEVEEMEIGMGVRLGGGGGEEEREVLVKTVPNTPPSLPSLELPSLSLSPSLPISSLRSSVEYTTPASPTLQVAASTSLQKANSSTGGGGFYASPYASSSQIYLGPSGGNGIGSREGSRHGSGEGSVHSRGSSASSRKSKEGRGSVSAVNAVSVNTKRDSASSSSRLSITPSPAALASRRSSRPAQPHHAHAQQLSVSGVSLRSPASDIFQYLNNSPHEHAQSLLPSPTISIFSASASGSFSASLSATSSSSNHRASTDGPPPRRPPPAPPLDLGLSTEEVRALRARGIRSPGAKVTTFGLGEGGGEGYRMSFGGKNDKRASSGGAATVAPGELGGKGGEGEGAGKGGMQLGLGGGFKFPAATPQAVMSAPVVKEERGSYFGVYGRRASPLGTAPPQVGEDEDGEIPEDVGVGVNVEDEEVDEEIEAVQREMAGIIFEKQRRSMSLSSEHVLDQTFEAYSHRPMDSSSSPLDPTHPYDVHSSHRPMDSVMDPSYQLNAAPSERQMEPSRGVDPFDYYHDHGDAYDDSLDVDAELGPDFAAEMGLTMGGPEDDTLKGHHPAPYRHERPGLSVVVPDHYPQSSLISTSPAVRSRGPSPLELGPRHGGLNADVDDMSRWSTASSLVLGKQSLDFPSLPVPQPAVASKRSSDSSKHSKSSSSSTSFFRRSHTKSTPSASSKPSTLQKDDFFEDDSVDGHDSEMYGLGGGVAGSMVVVPPQPTSSFSPDSPKGQAQSPPKRSLSKWRKRDRGNSVAAATLAPTSKSAPASPTKRRSHTVSAKDMPRDHLTVGKEGEQQVQREGKRGRLASFFSKIAKREVEEVPHPPAPWTLSGGQAQLSTPGSSSSGHGSPSLHPARARALTTGAADDGVRGVEGHWEGLAPVGRTSPAKEGVPPVPALPPLHTLPRMASRGSLRGVAVLNNASQSNGNGPPSSYSPVQTPYSPVQQYSHSPFGGSPRTSYVPTPVTGSSPRSSYVPSPILPPTHHSAAPSPVNSRRTTMTSNSNLSMGFQPAYSSELDLGFGPDESVPPTPTSIVSFASSGGASSGQVMLRTSRSAGNLLNMASPALEPASPPPPPVPPKDDDYAPIPPQSHNQSLKSATAGGVYATGYEWPPSEPLPASAFVPGGGRDEYMPLGRDSREEKKDGVLGRLRLKSSPSLGNLHHAKEVKDARDREKEGKGGLRGFVARMGGRT